MLTRNSTFISGRRRGSLYILTLASAIILVALGMGTAQVIHQFRRYSRSNYHGELAKNYAESGIRHAIYFTTVAPNWRQLLNSGVWLQDIPVDQAVYTVSGIDTIDGDLTNSADDPVIFTGIASLGEVTRRITVETQNPPSSLLAYAVASGGDILISNHVRITGNVTTNNNFNKTGGDTWVFGSVEAVGSINETTNISGTISPNSDPKTFPDSQSILNYYTSRATPIPYQSKIEKCMISPLNNPYGPANPDGLYVIDCAGEIIVISNVRIVGTLVILNPKSDSNIQDGLHWQPARPDYPAFITNSLITIKPTKDVDEHGIGDIDVSLPGEPGYGTATDIYSNQIYGVIYSSGDLTLDQNCTVNGMVMSGGILNLKDYTACQHNPAIILNPPKCFRESYLAPIQGTWQLVAPPLGP